MVSKCRVGHQILSPACGATWPRAAARSCMRPSLSYSEAERAILQVSLMFTDDEPQDPLLMGPEVRPRFQSDYEEQLEGSSAPEPAVAMAKRSRGRPAKSGKWQVCVVYSPEENAAACIDIRKVIHANPWIPEGTDSLNARHSREIASQAGVKSRLISPTESQRQATSHC